MVELSGYGPEQLGNRIRITWAGAEYRGRGLHTLWRGVIDVDGAAILSATPINRWNPERLFEQRGSSQLAFESVTTGNFAGVDLRLSSADATIRVKTNHGDIEIRAADLLVEPHARDCGGLDLATICRLPDDDLPSTLAFERSVALRQRDSPIWVCVTMEDGHRALVLADLFRQIGTAQPAAGPGRVSDRPLPLDRYVEDQDLAAMLFLGS